jgi:hypothetical protein
MSLDPLSRRNLCSPCKGVEPGGERRYTKLTVGEKVRLQFDNMVSDLYEKNGVNYQALTKFK